MPFNLTSYIKDKNNQLNLYLDSIFSNMEQGQQIVAAMKYSLMAEGKRLRPILCLAATEAVGGIKSRAMPAAAALEMIHTYSLIHDDLPAMDNDELRRGKPTCHVAFDEATAILAGDALLTLAFQILSAEEIVDPQYAGAWLQVIQTLSTAAGYGGMIQGQMLDISSEGRCLSRDELECMHRLKTGALITAAVHCGAIIGNAGQDQLEALDRYAENIGLAFQVADDILNVEGDPILMGKAVGTDRLRDKSTYPSILGLDASKQLAEELVRRALQAIENFDRGSDALRAIARYIIERRR
jgi:geranylgeranyl diphosphate synthase type II